MRQLLRFFLAAAVLAAAVSLGCGGQTVERPDEPKPMMTESNSATSPEPPPLPPD